MKTKNPKSVFVLYKDKYGDFWKKQGNYVVRKKDGMIGGWFNGEELIKCFYDKEQTR